MLEQRRPRQSDPAYLRWLRKQRCACGCLQAGPCDAAHLRAASLVYNKPLTGMGRKPDDFWALPLKRAHHMQQHAFGNELLWWQAHGVTDPWSLCLQHYARYGGNGAAPKLVIRKKAVRRKSSRPIPARPFSNAHRPLRRAPW